MYDNYSTMQRVKVFSEIMYTTHTYKNITNLRLVSAQPYVLHTIQKLTAGGVADELQ